LAELFASPIRLVSEQGGHLVVGIEDGAKGRLWPASA